MLIDIRDKNQYEMGHLSGAINIPFMKLYNSPSSYLDKNKKYTIYCESGGKSRILVNYLNHQGYNCVNLEGGYSKNLFQ